MRRLAKKLGVSGLLLAMLCLSSCDANVGMGISVGVPIGHHGYMSVGGSRWY